MTFPSAGADMAGPQQQRLLFVSLEAVYKELVHTNFSQNCAATFPLCLSFCRGGKALVVEREAGEEPTRNLFGYI